MPETPVQNPEQTKGAIFGDEEEWDHRPPQDKREAKRRFPAPGPEEQPKEKFPRPDII